MSVHEELKKDRNKAMDERRSECRRRAEKIIEETLMPAFKKAHDEDRVYSNAEICVLAYSDNYVVIPMPYNTDTIENFVYPETEKETRIEVEVIWNSVINMKEKYHFECLGDAIKIGRNGIISMLSMDLM